MAKAGDTPRGRAGGGSGKAGGDPAGAGRSGAGRLGLPSPGRRAEEAVTSPAGRPAGETPHALRSWPELQPKSGLTFTAAPLRRRESQTAETHFPAVLEAHPIGPRRSDAQKGALHLLSIHFWGVTFDSAPFIDGLGSRCS